MFKDTYTRAMPVCGASLLALCIGAPVLRMTAADGPETFQLATGDQLAPLPLPGIRSIAATWAAGQNVTGQGHAPAKGAPLAIRSDQDSGQERIAGGSALQVLAR